VTQTVRCEYEGAVAAITLNRPDAANALTVQAKEELLAAVRQCGADPQVRAVILTGAGRAFCAGQDLREHADSLASDERGSTPLETVRRHYNPITAAITGMPKPVIAAVNGVAAGAGASLAFACDFRIAAASASFLMAFARIGLGADSGASWTLQRLAGAAVAAELLMLAEPVSAQQALDLRLVTSVVPDEELAGAASALARRLAAGPTAAYAAIKDSLLFAAGHGLAQSLEHEADLQEQLGCSSDHRAATMAFLAKQQPAFEGR